jgi:hypothetical protein
MATIRAGHYEADGNAVNLVLGFVPNYIRVLNTAAADTEVAVIEWFYEMGDGVDIQWNNTDAGEQNFVYNASGGYINEYDTNSITTGTTLSVGGGQGVTISASYQDNSDEIYYLAILADMETDHGDQA